MLLVLMLTASVVQATHNRAGEITYRHIGGFTYEVTITTCTKSSVIADREWLQINWGDIPEGGQLDSLQRSEILPVVNQDAQINTYIGTHTYAGAGTYTLSMLDPNRNQDVENIPNSVDVQFCIRSELVISPVTGHNNSVVLLNGPKEQACLNQLWIHNPGAYDPDGDRLEYSLVECRGNECQVIQGYAFPDASTTSPSDVFSIDSESGDVTWDVPPQAGEYNIAILIEEFRRTDVGWVKVGSVVRDMQINVLICDNNPPEIEPLPDYCVLVDETVSFTVDASDPDGNNFTLSAVGGPITEVENVASFNTASGLFTWTPRCEEVREQPYQMVFKAEDFVTTVPLTDIETVNIRVIAPPVQNTNAVAVGSEISLSWDPHECLPDLDPNNFGNYSYKVYRRDGPSPWSPGECETGIPPEAGYDLVATVEGLESGDHLDVVEDLFSGFYCYRIVTCWPDGAESVASEEFCVEVQLDNPIMTRASVAVTDPVAGEVEVEWFTPIELDTEVFIPPYQYRLYHGEGFGATQDLIYTSSTSNDLLFNDLAFLHTGIDTESQGHTYRVEFYANGALASVSAFATTVYATLVPNDNELTIVANHQVPWFNTQYDFYRLNPTTAAFEFIGSSAEPSFTDTGLVNNTEYCYRIEATGTYSSEGLPDPLLNLSQEVCGEPFDLTPPCPPVVSATADCDAEQSFLDWVAPVDVCGSDDVTGYNVYYAPTDTSAFALLAQIDDGNTLTYTFNEFGDLNTIAGCFYVTALDSLLPGPDGVLQQNEGLPSNIVCTDNCPEYELPNVFTPNNDLVNDSFRPFPFKFVESVDFQVFNRWGGLVFQTEDPDIGWDGRSQNSGDVCSDGVYYYVVTVRTIRLTGIVEENYSGYLTIFDGQGTLNE